MSENGEKNVDHCFPKPKLTSLNVSFCPQPKNIQFTVIKDERNQKIFTFEKLKSENLDTFSAALDSWSPSYGVSSSKFTHVFVFALHRSEVQTGHWNMEPERDVQ